MSKNLLLNIFRTPNDHNDTLNAKIKSNQVLMDEKIS